MGPSAAATRVRHGASARLGARASGAALAGALAALCLLIAFVQRFGDTYLDSRIELTADPGLFLERVTSVWSPTIDLGHVHSGQFVGYLFPMAPWFAASDALGVPLWIGERLWLALVLWAGAWGVVQLLRSLYRPEVGLAHAVGALVFVCNPYVVVYVNRSTVTLLAWAALPWLLLAAHRGVREPHGWRWPAVGAIAVAAAGAGVNAAVVFWVVLAPVALVAYELVVLRGRVRAIVSFAWRAALLTVLASAWWLVPLAIQFAYGADLIGLSEKPETIWASATMAESLRLLGLWVSYYAGGFGEIEPASRAVDPLLLSRPVIAATFVLPLAAFGGLLVSRRWRWAPFFGLLAVAALVVMSIGYPLEKRSAKALLDLYYDVPALQFLRTTYKAAPVLAISLACLAGVAVGELVTRLRERHGDDRWRRLARWAPAAVVPVLVLAALPLFTGRAIERHTAYGEVPPSWPAALRDAERAMPPDRRIMVLPGQQFSYFRWGRTESPLAPALTRRPVLQRSVARPSGGRAAQLQDAVDDLVQQRRLVPGQLAPLLAWLGVGQVVVGADGRPGQSAEAAPTAIADALRGQPGFERPAATYGPSRIATPAAGDTGPRVRLPALRRYDAPGGTPGIVRLRPLERATVLEGDAHGLAALAAAGRLDADRAVFYAGELDGEELAEHLRSGADLVLTDTHRHQILNPSSILKSAGPILTADVPLPKERPAYGLFEELGTAAQTVAVRPAFARLDSPASPVAPLTDENRPEAAVDGRLSTSWYPPDDRAECICLELSVRTPAPVASIRVHPRAFGLGVTVPLRVSVDGGAEVKVDVTPQAWNEVRLPAPGRTIRLRASTFTGRYGLDEVQIPGVRPREMLRLPTRLATMAGRQDLSRNGLAIELLRTTADAPTRSDDDDDPELAIARSLTLPAARRFRVTGWALPSSSATDAVLDRLTGLPRDWRFASSGRLEGVPGRRASAAFDGRPDTAWAADSSRGERPWLSWHAPRPAVVRRFRLVRGPEEYAFPDRLDVVAGQEQFDDVPVGADGTVTLPRAVETSDVLLDVTRVAAPQGRALKREVQAVAVAEIEVPGLNPPRAATQGPLRTACGALTVQAGAARATARVTGTIEALNAGDPLRVTGCGPGAELALPAGASMLTARSAGDGAMRPYRLSLVSPAPAGAPAQAPAPGEVLSAGDIGDGSREGVRLRLTRPAWLVLAETYNKGWRAWCTTRGGQERSLGAPRPIDGYANGWRAEPDCVSARFAFAPQRAADVSYAVSAGTGVGLLLGLLAVPLWRRRRRPLSAAAVAAEPAWPAPDAVVRAPPARSLAVGALLGVICMAVFGVRFGLVIGAATAVVAWYGVTARRLLAGAAVAIALVVLLYVASSEPLTRVRPTEQLSAHWLATAAVCALGAACALDAWRLRRRARRPDR